MTNLKNKSTSCYQTRNRYNEGQLYKSKSKRSKNYVFAVDWFEVYCLHGLGKGLLKDFDPEDIQETYQSSHTLLVKDKATGNGTKNYKYGFDVSFNGQSIGLLLLCPRHSYRDEYSCSFKVHNHILYQRSWTLIVEALIEDIGIQINNVTRLDLACDGSGFMSKYALLNSGTYQNVGKARHGNYQTGKNEIEGFNIGSRSSNKSITGYRKGKRLLSEHKSYISDYWKLNELVTPQDNVERLELRLKNKAIKSIVGFDYTRLHSQEYIAGLMKANIDGFFQLVKNSLLSKDKNITRSKKLDVIPWSKLDLENTKKMRKINKPQSVWAAKRYITFGLQMIKAGYYYTPDMFKNEERKRLAFIAQKYKIVPWFEDLEKRIEERDKSQIEEMRYNRMEFEASGNSIYPLNH